MNPPAYFPFKKLLTAVFFANICLFGFSQSVGIGTSTPDSSAQLDVTSTNKGFLPPRVALSATNVQEPVHKPATGLLVYNTASAGATPFNVKPGYYFWNGTVWYPVVNKGNAAGEMQYWDGVKWVLIPLGLNGQMLTICRGIPQWGNCASDSLVIKPANNPNESSIGTNFANVPGTPDTQLTPQAWTAGGNPLTQRTIIKHNLSSLPLGAVIDSAKLYLFAMPEPHGGNLVDPHSGSSNACLVQRITSTWTSPSPFTWNSPPAISTINQVAIPQSTSSFQNSVLDVTNLIKDLVTNGNYGLLIRLQNEVIYNIRQFASSWYSDASKHPKLIIYYH
ncbi:MAG: DNRLRE domain-containing protein [Bacteroidota bacterium]